MLKLASFRLTWSYRTLFIMIIVIFNHCFLWSCFNVPCNSNWAQVWWASVNILSLLDDRSCWIAALAFLLFLFLFAHRAIGLFSRSSNILNVILSPHIMHARFILSAILLLLILSRFSDQIWHIILAPFMGVVTRIKPFLVSSSLGRSDHTSLGMLKLLFSLVGS